MISETTGKPTEGWYCRYALSENTRHLVAEHDGFLYDSEAYNDERLAELDWLVAPDTRHEKGPTRGRALLGYREV